MDILVFKTSVSGNEEIEPLQSRLNALGKWNFDLEDCDRILRIECNGGDVQPAEVVRIMREQGFCCAELE